MADPTTPPGTRQGKLSPTARTRPESPLLEQPNFGYRSEAPHQTFFSAANANPFATLEKLNPEEEDLKHTQEEMGEWWVFQAGRKLAPRFVSPGKAPPPSPTHTPTQDCASGSRRKRTRSEVHNSFFTSLGIPVPLGQDFARARVWPVLSRERDNQKEILVNVKGNDLPNLPLHIRCMSASEEEWTPASALKDLTRSVESELEEKILRFSLSLRGRLALEWSWQEDQAKGGWECSILAHINTGSSGISAQKRKNLHWRTLEFITSMNNDVVFAGPAHSLLLKTGPASTDRQTRKSTSASLLASPQAVRKKKRYVKFDLSSLVPSNPSDLSQAPQLEEDTGQGVQKAVRYVHMGSIGQPAAQSHSGHV
jgi:hypothetical protein